MLNYSTQMDAARKEIITNQMELVAGKEHMDIQQLKELIQKARL